MHKSEKEVKILFFASLREAAGTKEIIVQVPVEAKIRDVKRLLVEQLPGLKTRIDTVLVSINHEFAFDEDKIPNQAEIALFPPVSGGGDGLPDPDIICQITEDAIDLNAVISSITQNTTGAVALFVGSVRGITKREEAHETEHLEYEAYQPMAEIKMRQITQEIRSHWPGVERIAIIQRIGRLLPGTPSVVIACASAHRDTGVFEAARYGIDRLKEIVPVWKKEVSPDGEMWVEGDYIPVPGE